MAKIPEMVFGKWFPLLSGNIPVRFTAPLGMAQYGGEHKREGGENAQDEIQAGRTGALIDGASEEGANDAAEADENGAAYALGCGADMGGCTLVDVGHTAGTDEGVTNAIEGLDGQNE